MFSYESAREVLRGEGDANSQVLLRFKFLKALRFRRFEVQD
jgi:hypothetical protein